MAATENETEVIILFIFACDWPIKETSVPRSFSHGRHYVKLCQVHQHFSRPDNNLTTSNHIYHQAGCYFFTSIEN